MIDAVISLIAFVAIKMAKNVRLESRYNLPPLMEDIRANGLKTPISVYKDGEKYPVLQGHRRTRAIALLKETDPARYKELFSEGIPCIVREVSGERDIARFKVDHGNELSLTDPFELQMCASMLFDVAYKEREVVVELSGMMDRISPMKAEKRTAIENASTQSEKDKILFEYRRGLVQGLHNAHRCPPKVMAALEFKATGEQIEGYDGEYLPKLTTSMVQSLWKAHSEDLKVEDGEGRKVFSKRRTGPKFNEKWDKIVESSQKREADKEEGVVREKAMSGKDMKTEIKDGKWLSDFGTLLTKHHSGDKSVGDLTPYDETCYLAELVKEADQKLWKAVVKAAKAIEVRAQAAVAEAEAAKVEAK